MNTLNSMVLYKGVFKMNKDEDVYAISELLQWLFRSNCRLPDGSVTLAIASKRMYDLYVDWTKGRFKDEF